MKQLSAVILLFTVAILMAMACYYLSQVGDKAEGVPVITVPE